VPTTSATDALRDNRPMQLEFAGAVLDVAAVDVDRSEAFYTVLLGRPADLRPQSDQREWRLHGRPEVGLRISCDAKLAGYGTVSIGVMNLASEVARLAATWPNLPAPTEKPGVIMLVRFPDPDGNMVTMWQDLLHVGPS
jgi:hypothetical protein